MSDPSIKIKYFSLKVLKLFFPSFLGVLVFFGVITTIIYQIDKSNELRFIKENEQLRTSKLTEMINIHLNFVFTDLLILGQSDLLKYYINEFKNDDKEALARTFLVYSQERKIFDQIRLLSENGKELMRVNYNNGNPYIVPENKLKEKGKRYYFRDTYQLNRGQIYMSPLDLNIEFGQLELPQKPIIRFGLPVFNDSGEKKGVLILNYLAQDFIIHFEHGRLFSSSGRNMLLNSNGYWLYNEEKGNCWGFMNKNKLDLTFGNTFPDAWKQIDNNRAGKLVNDKGLFTFNTIYPLVEGVKSSSGAIEAYSPSQSTVTLEEYYWKIVTWVPHEGLFVGSKRTLFRILQFEVILFIFCALLLWYLSYITLVKRQTTEELTESNSMKELLLDVIAHDLKNPAGVIKGFAQFGLENDPNSEILKEINGGADNLLNVINSATILSKVAIGDTIEKEELNLVNIINSIINENTTQLQYEGMTINMKLKGKLIVNANPIISEVFRNYISNAIKYAKTGKKIIIDAIMEDGFVIVNVKDFGKTIEKKDCENIFIRNVQLDKTKGRGIGLAIVKRIAIAHDAEVGVKPNKPKGCIFYIKIPTL